ncbi:uncharacterized protein CELE_C44B12.6 [Caenorhabditis elegans]|uniref:Uncharacterized protein n=1 Tax=Caenorhabditis elegans TaxID=6239 RepID=A0A0S4XRS1_CAEEL|nr:Uncharacterized protein CELE_C44B12.6 [Caenorhabditis elegans]CUV67100.1 Uncharacterized protein CELE_C44B12.6 [Caenorhabditis elegans]|eukprot:NP_001305187.1 Uncharacterized protein CELE_C44B12.6 [Caenorhabditis elegans]
MVRRGCAGQQIWIIELLSLDARITRRHQKRSAETCASTANQQMHEAFSRLINRRDEDMFSFFQPDSQIFLEYQPLHRHMLTPKSRDCSEPSIDKSSEVLPDQPLSERSICPYHHILNYDEKRIPAAISEVECSCPHVKVHGGIIHCEPMMYNMRVMLFDDSCDKYVERVQKVALACVPVFSNHISSGTHSHSLPTPPSTPL